MKYLTLQNQQDFFTHLTMGEQFRYDPKVGVLGDVIELASDSGVEVRYVFGFVCQVVSFVDEALPSQNQKADQGREAKS